MIHTPRMDLIRELRAEREFAMGLNEAADFIPAGYRPLRAAREELGARELRLRLSAGRLRAHFWGSDGSIKLCAQKFWASQWAEAAIATGSFTKYRLLLSEDGAGREVTTDRLGQDKTYISPFLQRMIEASHHFDLGSAGGKQVKKATLVAWFKEKHLPNGDAISRHLAENMASLCRHPDAMRGGNKRSVDVGPMNPP